VSLYVHLNPVSTELFSLGERSGIPEKQGWVSPSREEVTRRLKEMREYRWSSYRGYAGYEKAPDWLETGELLRRASRKTDQRLWQYREDVKNRLCHGVEEEKKERLLDAVAVGGEGFRQKLKGLTGGGRRETSGKRDLRQRIAIN